MIEAVLELSAMRVAGESHRGRRGGEIIWHGRQLGQVHLERTRYVPPPLRSVHGHIFDPFHECADTFTPRRGRAPCFTHLKSDDVASDKPLVLAAILAGAINLGLTKMAESSPGTTYAKLSWLQARHNPR